jgi:phosphatidylglycerophosphate synthase
MQKDGGRSGADAIPGYVTRPRELQDWLNFRLYHPLAWRLARLFARTPVTPNMLSVVGGLMVIAAAVAYVQPGWPWPALVGLTLHMAWHVIDGADGDLARLTGRSGPIGEIVDGICDYASHFVLYVILALMLQTHLGWFAWVPAVTAGVSRIVQANYAEVQRRQYQWWVYGVSWLRTGQPDGLAGNRVLAALRAAYLGLSRYIARHATQIDAAIAGAAGDPVHLDRVRSAVRREAPRLLAGVPTLSANLRTIFLGLSMLAGSPMYFFLYEVLVLNAVLVWSIRNSDAAARRVLANLDHAEASTRR